MRVGNVQVSGIRKCHVSFYWFKMIPKMISKFMFQVGPIAILDRIYNVYIRYSLQRAGTHIISCNSQ